MNIRKLNFVLATCVLLTCAFAGTTDAQEWARKMFKEYTHSFGKVQLGDVPEYRFEIQNIYKETIRIQSVTSSCGCTVATVSKNELKMWEKGEVICKFNTPAVGLGFKQATVTLRFAFGQFVGEAQLTVSGNIVGGLNFSPDSIDFGQVTSGKMPTATVQLSHSGNPMFNIADIKSTFGHIRVMKRETARRGNYVSYNLTAQLKDTAPMGYVRGELFIVYNENPNARDQFGNPILKQIPLEFTAKVGSPVQIAPEILALGTVEVGQKVEKKVFLTADVPFKIKDVKCKSSAFSVKADREAKKVHIVEVTYTGEDKPGKHECDLSFYTDLGAGASGVMKAIVDIPTSVGEVSTSLSNVK